MNRLAFLLTGTLLFLLFVLQGVLDWRWEALYELQHEQMYRRWSGLGLSLVILFQWILSLVRTTPRWENLSYSFYKIHNWVGAFTPLLFYLHSMELGFAYLFVLSITFLGNFLLGLVNPEVVRNRSQLVFQGWMILHVACSLFITSLTIYHVWVVFYYK